MVQCWMSADCGDSLDEQRSQLQLDPPQPVSLEELKAASGVLYWKVSRAAIIDHSRSLLFSFGTNKNKIHREVSKQFYSWFD